MSSFESLPVELLQLILVLAGELGVVQLARTSQQVAVAVAAGVQTQRCWRVAYSVYLCARYAAGIHVNRIVSRFYFLPGLSRACRCCGRRTQRRVAGVLLCCRCTRDHRNRCWMVGIASAHRLGIYSIYSHAGARTRLVFAEHLQVLAGMTRKQLLLTLGYPASGI